MTHALSFMIYLQLNIDPENQHFPVETHRIFQVQVAWVVMLPGRCRGAALWCGRCFTALRARWDTCDVKGPWVIPGSHASYMMILSTIVHIIYIYIYVYMYSWILISFGNMNHGTTGITPVPTWILALESFAKATFFDSRRMAVPCERTIWIKNHRYYIHIVYIIEYMQSLHEFADSKDRKQWVVVAVEMIMNIDTVSMYIYI